MNTPTDAPPQVDLGLLTAVGHWWWRRWSRPCNPLYAALTAICWMLAAGMALGIHTYVVAEDRPNAAADAELVSLLTVFIFIAIANCFGYLARSLRGQTVEFDGRRKDVFVMLTVASYSVDAITLLYIIPRTV